MKDTAFLMQQMEWREALEDIRESTDHQAIINELYDSFAAYRLKLTKLLTAQLSSGSDEDALLAADQVRKLKFMAKLQDELTRIEDALLD